MNPVISVIIPVYNAASFIHETIQSVLNQVFSAFEIIIVNDGSTDSTENIILSIDDPRIVYVRQTNKGVAYTRNVAIQKARGEFITFLDADDLYLPENLKVKLEFLRSNPTIPLVHACEIKLDSATNQPIEITNGVGGHVLEYLLAMSQPVIHSPTSVMLKRSLIDEVGGFDTQLSTSADWELWVRIAARYPIGFIAEPLTKYRLHCQQMHLNINTMEKDMHFAFRKCFQNKIFKSREYYNFCYAKLSLILCACYLGHTRNYGKFLKYAGLSLWYDPIHVIRKFKSIVCL